MLHLLEEGYADTEAGLSCSRRPDVGGVDIWDDRDGFTCSE